jgi:hypothetical protein
LVSARPVRPVPGADALRSARACLRTRTIVPAMHAIRFVCPDAHKKGEEGSRDDRRKRQSHDQGGSVQDQIEKIDRHHSHQDVRRRRSDHAGHVLVHQGPLAAERFSPGEMEIGIAIPIANVRQLGQALIAASPDQAKPPLTPVIILPKRHREGRHRNVPADRTRAT